jgi:peptidoglycan hydrolase CwlO-like protein
MNIEWTILLSVVSVSAAIYFGLKRNRREEKADDQKESANMTTVVVKLETISNGIIEIKGDLRNVRDEIRSLGERQAKTEESLKSAWARINELARGGGGGA